MKTVKLELTQEQFDALISIAEQAQTTVPALICHNVDRYLISHDESYAAERKRKLLSVVGIGNSGVSDLAQNHDKYLAEIYAEVGK